MPNLELVYNIVRDLISGDAWPAAEKTATLDRGNAKTLQIWLKNGDDGRELAADETLRLILNPADRPDLDPPALSVDYTVADLVEGSTYKYLQTVSLINDVLNGLLFIDGDPANDLPEILLIGNVVLLDNTDAEIASSQPFSVLIKNQWGRAGAGTPNNLPSPLVGWLRNPGYWTALTGGGATALDGIVTAADAVPTGSVVATALGGVLRYWQLQATTAAENASGGIVRPDDYNGATNARAWVQIQ